MDEETASEGSNRTSDSGPSFISQSKYPNNPNISRALNLSPETDLDGKTVRTQLEANFDELQSVKGNIRPHVRFDFSEDDFKSGLDQVIEEDQTTIVGTGYEIKLTPLLEQGVIKFQINIDQSIESELDDVYEKDASLDDIGYWRRMIIETYYPDGRAHLQKVVPEFNRRQGYVTLFRDMSIECRNAAAMMRRIVREHSHLLWGRELRLRSATTRYLFSGRLYYRPIETEMSRATKEGHQNVRDAGSTLPNIATKAPNNNELRSDLDGELIDLTAPPIYSGDDISKPIESVLSNVDLDWSPQHGDCISVAVALKRVFGGTLVGVYPLPERPVYRPSHVALIPLGATLPELVDGTGKLSFKRVTDFLSPENEVDNFDEAVEMGLLRELSVNEFDVRYANPPYSRSLTHTIISELVELVEKS